MIPNAAVLSGRVPREEEEETLLEDECYCLQRQQLLDRNLFYGEVGLCRW